ncbi:hypothetical protein B0T20DRAFT_499109 [Sordaria brevicollis]|uniref:Uncharacterized protein n=1 Tax=Sordaria brevicollis TaxID=83679 RepID=A0AAE0PCQ8_SORBR|nr:hypothetical protein B0T20DRAFT_499109 [Sordaria brevicollis]
MQLPTISFLLLLLGGGLTIAAPIAEECHSPHILCFDAVNPCGVIYSGCYDKCKPETRPQAPACPPHAPPKPSISYSTSLKTITATKIETITHPGTIAPTAVVPLPTTIISIITEIITITTDFGATKTKADEPSIITEIVTITTDFGAIKTKSGADNCSSRTVCIDYIDKCGQTYGGCVPDCFPWPTFSAPPCPRPTTVTATATGVVGG